MGRNIKHGQPGRACAIEIYGFVAEGREGGKSAEDADEKQGPRFGTKDGAGLGKLRQKSDGETANQIYCESAVGKTEAAARILQCDRDRVTEDRSQKSAAACQKYFEHANDPLPDLVGVISPAGS